MVNSIIRSSARALHAAGEMKIILILLFLLFFLFAPAPSYSQDIPQEKCKDCHDTFDFKAFNSSKHVKIGCTGCHADIRSLPHRDDGLETVKCQRCHQKAFIEFSRSIHGKALASGIQDAPKCWSCHGAHDVHSKLEAVSHVNPSQIPATCGGPKCHSNPEIAKKYGIPVLNPLSHYNKSVHAKKLASGDMKSATCVKCHGGHEVLPLKDVNSPIHKDNVPKTCSKCHESIYKEFTQSVHWTGFKQGVVNSPVCTDCHMEHEVLSPSDPKSSVSHEKVPTLCTDCHNNSRLMNRYNIPVRSLDSYLNSFHGLALKSGNLESADCTSCHGAHFILKSTDPKSSVNTANLPKTCGGCHPGVGIGLKNTKIHAEAKASEIKGARIVNSVKVVYIILIIASVGGMFAFVLLDLVAKTRRKRKIAHGAAEEAHHPGPQRYFMRFNKEERAMHLVTLITFLTLVYTGFCRSYPESFFAYPMSKIFPHELRDWLHRISGVVITLNIVLQIVLFFATKRGREELKYMLPSPKDLKDAVHMIKYNLGRVKTHTHFDRFSFMEKFEYWALIWGSIVMGLSGVALWFKEKTLSLFPSWVLDLAQVLHFYEAVLASLAILIWHFYWVIFNPDVYPLDTKFITGKISEEHLMHEHYDEWLRLTQTPGKAEAPYTISTDSIDQKKMSGK